MGLILTILLAFVLSIFGAGYLTGRAVTRRRAARDQRTGGSLASAYDQGYRRGASDAASPTGTVPVPDHEPSAHAVAAPQPPAPHPSDAPGGTTGPPAWSAGALASAAATRPATTSAGRAVPPDHAPGAYTPVAPAAEEHAVPPDHAPGTYTPVAPTPEERAAQRAARDLRTINIALYSASLLLVAAGGLFIGAAVPGAARAATIVVVVALFYVSGLVLYTRLPRLQPAAVAFTGTGLALLPVAGLLFGVLTGQGPLAWFATALIGTAAYLVAAVRLQSRVVAFLTLPFFLSIALSSVSLLGGALVWYFTSSIGVAALLAGLLRLAPRWLPDVVSRAVVDTHRFLAPAALVASLLLGDLLGEADRAQLWIVATAYYAALVAFFDVRRIQHFYALRLVVSIATVLTAWAADSSAGWGSLLLAGCLALQIAGLLAVPGRARMFLDGPRPPVADGPGVVPRRNSLYSIDILATFAILSLAAGAAVLTSIRPMVTGSEPDALLPMLLVLVTGMGVAVRCGGMLELLVLPGVLLSAMTRWEDPWRTETVLALTIGYLLARAVRSTGRRRERFVLAARGALTALAPIAVLVHLQPPLVPPRQIGEFAGLALLMALSANQLVEVLRWRRRSPSVYSTWVVCGASGLSLASAVALASGAETSTIAAVGLWICVVAGCTTSLVLPLAEATPHVPPAAGTHDPATPAATGPADVVRGGPLRQASAGGVHRAGAPAVPGALIEAIGPASLAVAAVAGVGADFGFRSYEVLLVVAVAYGALMARRAHDTLRRGAYLLAVQLSVTTLTATVSADLDLSVHAVFAVMAVSVALQELVRVVLRSRFRRVGLQGSSAWLSIGLLATLPLAYPVFGDPDVQLDVIALHLILLGVVSAVLFLVQRKDGTAYPALYAGAALIAVLSADLGFERAGYLPVAPLPEPVAALIAVACAVALVVVRARSSAARLRMPSRVGVGLFGVESILFAFTDGAGWDRVVVTAAVAAICFTLAQREAVAGLDAGGAVAVIVAATAFVDQVDRVTGAALGPDAMRLLGGAVLAAALLQLARVFLPGEDEDELRYRILGGMALGWTAGAAVLAMPADGTAVAGSAVLAAVAVLGAWEVRARIRPLYCEAAFLVVVLSAQRVAWLILDGIVFFWAAQWGVISLALLSAWSFTRGAPRRGPLWLAASAAVLSATGLMTVAGGTTEARIWALCGHVALLAAGVALSRRLFSLWGAVGIALALLWFLRGFTFLLLTVAALLLLAFAVWKLNRQGQGPATGAHAGPGSPGDLPRSGPRVSVVVGDTEADGARPPLSGTYPPAGAGVGDTLQQAAPDQGTEAPHDPGAVPRPGQ